MAVPTWESIIATMETVAKLYNSSNTKTIKAARSSAQELAMDLFGCTAQEVQLLAAAFQDNAMWLVYGIRKHGLMKACQDTKLRKLLRKLFVLENPSNLLFYTSGVEISKRLGVTTRGLGWKRTPDIVRIRKNGVMNWGTADTAYSYYQQMSDPVVLIPKKDLSKSVIFFGGRKLVRYCYDTYMAAHKIDDKHMFTSFGKAASSVDFWQALYMFAYQVQAHRDERECFTLTDSVSCQVYSISAKELLDKAYMLDKVTRKPVTLDDK